MALSMDRFVGKLAVVTGASGGIGGAIARKLVEEGVQVFGIDIRPEGFDELTKKVTNKRGKFHLLIGDVSKEEDIIRAIKWATSNLGPIHILVNAAGIIPQTNLMDGDAAKWKKAFDINVIGLCIATREAIRNMRANNIDGHIVHINSIGGHHVSDFPGLNVYPASKFAVTALTESLRQEFRQAGSKIKVSSVSPGSTRTNIFKNNTDEVDEETSKVLAGRPYLDPEDVADGVVYVLSTPPHVQVHELTIKPVGEREL